MNQKNAKILIGVDEAGRGCLAGPVVSASVAIYEDQIINGVNDSKLLSPKKRESLYDVIQNECLGFSIKSIDNHVIDEKNILVATLESMKEAIDEIEIAADEIVNFGFRAWSLPITVLPEIYVVPPTSSLKLSSVEPIATFPELRICIF